MSSTYVRDEIKTFLSANTTEKIVDLSGHFEEIQDLIKAYGVGPKDDWVGLLFVGSDEIPITIGSNNTQGRYRETGVVEFHVVGLAKLGGSNSILLRADALRSKLRGQRIGNIFVESVTPANFGGGSALRFEGGYVSATFLISYETDFNY